MKVNIAKIHKKYTRFCLLFFFVLLGWQVHAQTTIVRGVITDAATKETLPYVSILIPGTTIGTSADDEGHFSIKIDGNYSKLRFAYIGYVTVEKDIKPGEDQVVNVQMKVDARMLNEVVVTGKKGRYRNKNNPAVELIRQVIAHKKENQMENYDFVQFEEYSKLSMALSNLSDKFKEKRIFRNYQFLFAEQDSNAIGGKNVLPAYMEEKLSNIYFRKNPYKKKRYILADKKAEFDPHFIDNDGVSNYLHRLYEDINIYDNDISITTNLFLSPIANNSPTFYKFFISDTVKTEKPWLVELSFVPRNKADMLFEGKLFITLDGNYAVQNAYLTVNKDINLNFMRDLQAKLEYSKNPDGRYHLSKSTLTMEFALGDKGGGILGERTVSFQKYLIGQSQPDSIYKGPDEEIAYNPEVKTTEEYWKGVRHMPLELREVGIYKNVDTLQTIKSFRRIMDWGTVLLAGYKSFGKFEMGPASTFYSFNPVEGFRLRLGGRTTTDLSKRMFFETYGAYGFRDKKWKYFLSATYSLNNKSVYSFPLHYFKASYQHDTKIPGQELQFVQEDNFLLSFKRGDNNRWLYNDIAKFEYVHELPSRFSYKVGFTHWRQRPAGVLIYQREDANGNLVNVNELTSSEVNVELRYAPNEQFYQGKVYRIPIFNKYPIFTLRYNMGLKNVFNSTNDYHNFSANIFKRVYLSQFGYSDVTLEGGYIFGENIPFPLLAIHRANQTYAYQLNSYNLMNFLEFVSDHYAAVNVQYYLNGFIFNKIPLLKRLKWREVVSFKGLWGGLRNENNPNYNNSVYKFSMDENGLPITYTLGSKPYIEGSVGIANIFKLVRVDLIRRFTYLENPNVSEWGIRARVKFDF
ncbi:MULTISPECIES: DUF5686 and carboxypeptidase-like regulatory domain-containing protein [Olivibacter]|uniref:DUF5686 family protein n=2 Tax=Olivibacter TaxID=376469 RepID=A0ABV6HLL9_9SPHI|nr:MULTISPECIES: DUF5686 and carboxypeptidase-like regulatory domain-containing protein [Olivibacter]MCL4638888.1 DUF5686 and carboxypeptidase regulatory-like domain-containing protein [Olivibacter sp. UJ_SKK_5.1]MDM8174891.1 DUF5686 family protein [Olivibacter sp. 47]MDX3913430.1 DUF5686 family protein [Pseudosphingobacterium sp.]QEL01676.1 carboxypeptidase-like regulatory domain-containing protein [Olivibacter sp. LS-1]